MKYASLTAAILLCLNLSACSDDDDNTVSNEPPATEAPPSTTPPVTHPTTPEDEVPVPKIHLDENFDQLSALPDGWMTPRNNAGSVYLENGDLFIDGRAHNTQMTTVLLPEEFQKLRNYRIDMEFSFIESNNTGRWASILYRAADQFADPSFIPYYQFAMREETTGASGLELSLRMPNNTWNVLQKSAHTENIGINNKQKATVIVHGNRVRHYLNDQLILDSTLPYNLDQGGIGISTAGLLMQVSHFKVTEQLEKLPESNKVTEIIDQQLPVSMPPTLAHSTTQNALVPTSATHAVFHLDESLNITTLNKEKVTTLQSYLKDSSRQTLPLFSIQNENTIQALKGLAEDYDLADITLLSSNPELLRKARISLPMLRTALDYSQATNFTNSKKDIVTIAHNTNTSLSKIVILPPQLTNRDTVSHLQRLLITPWAKQDGTDVLRAAQVLSTGVNGILTAQPELYHDLMKRMAPNTLLRKPLITGHRGIPALDDENTLEGTIKAIQVGADAVEYDVYLTKDNHVILMHDTTTRTTGVERNTEDMTLAEIRELRTVGYQRPVPTMDEVLAEVKKYPHVTNFIEIKSYKPEIIPKIKELLDKHDAYDQSIVISFSGDQILNMKNILPGVSTGFLTSTPAAQSDIVNTRRILDNTQKYSSTFNPSFGGLSKDLMNMAAARGVTFWPWTFRLNKDDFNRMYVQGTHGLTTDYAHDASNFVVKLETPKQVTTTVGKPVEIQGQTFTQVGAKANYVFKQMLVLPNSSKYTQNGQGVTFTEKGTAYVMPSYHYSIAPNYTYTIYAEPVTVTVQ